MQPTRKSSVDSVTWQLGSRKKIFLNQKKTTTAKVVFYFSFPPPIFRKYSKLLLPPPLFFLIFLQNNKSNLHLRNGSFYYLRIDVHGQIKYWGFPSSSCRFFPLSFFCQKDLDPTILPPVLFFFSESSYLTLSDNSHASFASRCAILPTSRRFAQKRKTYYRT